MARRRLYGEPTPDQADRERARKIKINRKRQGAYERGRIKAAKNRRLPDGPRFYGGYDLDSYENT